ncbi:hypothetical protein BASA81_003314 [Batrachochytrium salamandrivorans]|nr:hypothetical protein BASA81_003314 [Batrachochytrium salamandrivorans]
MSFIELEAESRQILGKLRNLVERRAAVRSSGRGLIASPFDFDKFDFQVISQSEQLLVQLNQVVVDMSLVAKKQSANSNLNQEYARKLQLLETIKPLGEFAPGADLEFYTSLELAWRSNSRFGVL